MLLFIYSTPLFTLYLSSLAASSMSTRAPGHWRSTVAIVCRRWCSPNAGPYIAPMAANTALGENSAMALAPNLYDWGVSRAIYCIRSNSATTVLASAPKLDVGAASVIPHCARRRPKSWSRMWLSPTTTTTITAIATPANTSARADVGAPVRPWRGNKNRSSWGARW